MTIGQNILFTIYKDNHIQLHSTNHGVNRTDHSMVCIIHVVVCTVHAVVCGM